MRGIEGKENLMTVGGGITMIEEEEILMIETGRMVVGDIVAIVEDTEVIAGIVEKIVGGEDTTVGEYIAVLAGAAGKIVEGGEVIVEGIGVIVEIDIAKEAVMTTEEEWMIAEIMTDPEKNLGTPLLIDTEMIILLTVTSKLNYDLLMVFKLTVYLFTYCFT